MELLQLLAHSAVAPHVLAFVIGIPSGALYLLQVVLVLRHRQKEFNSSFFQLFLVRAIPSLVNLLVSYLCPRFLFLGLFFPFYARMPTILFNCFLFSSYCAFHMENLSTTMLSLNRLTAILFPLAYDKMWIRLLPVSVAAILVLPIFFSASIFNMDMQLYYHDSSNTSFGFVNGADTPITEDGSFPCTDMLAYSNIFFSVVCFAFNVKAWTALRQHNAKFTKQSVESAVNDTVATEHQRVEQRLFVYSFCTFLCQSVMTTFYYGIYLSTKLSTQGSPTARLWANALWFNYGLISDICTVAVPSWLMVWSSSQMRQMLGTKAAHVIGLFRSLMFVNRVQPVEKQMVIVKSTHKHKCTSAK